MHPSGRHRGIMGRIPAILNRATHLSERVVKEEKEELVDEEEEECVH